MFNSKMYKKYYPIKSSFDIANMNVAEQKKLIYWIKSLSEDIRLHNTNSLKKAMQYRENEYRVVEVNCTDDNIASLCRRYAAPYCWGNCTDDNIASLCNKISCNSDSITDNEISLINAVLYRHKYVKIIGMYCFPVMRSSTNC